MAPGKYERNVRHNIFSAIKRIKYWNEFGDFTQWEQPKLWNVRENKTTRKKPSDFHQIDRWWDGINILSRFNLITLRHGGCRYKGTISKSALKSKKIKFVSAFTKLHYLNLRLGQII